MDTRVQDYLDDRLQSGADFDTLDTLLESVKNQQELLKQQLTEARSDHEAAKVSVREHIEAVRSKANAFEKEQDDIDRRLLLVTQSENSDEAFHQFESSMRKLQKLEMAAGYVELLKEVDILKKECVTQLGKSDNAALKLYWRLQRLLSSLRPLQEATEGAAPHLMDHVEIEVLQLRDTIRQSFAGDLEKTLKKMNWPKAVETVPMALQKEWATNVGRLLDLQRQELQEHDDKNSSIESGGDPPALLPLEVMAHPIEQRFIYHFSGLIADYSDFLLNALQPLLVQHFRGSDLAFTPAYIDATSAFITALLPMLKRKLTSFAGQVSNQPQLLSHLVHEIMAFDTTLQETYAYSPSSPSIPWRGLAYYLLDTRNYYESWLAVERDFALARYHAIIENPEAGELDYDSLATDATKPSKAAIRVNDLLETVTDRYRPLSSFSQKLRFLMDIQITIFDDFHHWLNSGLEAYVSMTSAVGRRVQGISKQDQNELQGVKGLDRLCRVFGSAEYLERAMRDWSDDVFFLELWEALQLRARNGGAHISSKLGDLQEIQQKTSSAVGEEDYNGEVSQGALFDETGAIYHRLRVHSESVIVDTLSYNIREALRPYARVSTWASLSSSTNSSGSTSAELDPTLRLLTDYFAFLARAVGKAALRRITRQVCQAMQSFLWDNLLIRHTFSTAGTAQMSTDINAVCALIDRYVGTGQAQIGLRKLLEGVMLISLPLHSGSSRAGRSGEEDGDDGETAAWNDADDDAQGGERYADDVGGENMGLNEVERLVFMDNESARYALQQLGLQTLSEGDARAVLEKRIELQM